MNKLKCDVCGMDAQLLSIDRHDGSECNIPIDCPGHYREEIQGRGVVGSTAVSKTASPGSTPGAPANPAPKCEPIDYPTDPLEQMRVWADSHEGTWPVALRDLLVEHKKLKTELSERDQLRGDINELFDILHAPTSRGCVTSARELVAFVSRLESNLAAANKIVEAAKDWEAFGFADKYQLRGMDAMTMLRLISSGIKHGDSPEGEK